MANHLHRQIREALETALTGLATTGANVFANRLAALDESKLPALRIYADAEESARQDFGTPHLQERTLALVVECCAKEAANLDDTLDQISKEVEVALAAGITLGGAHLDFTYLGMEFDDELANKPVGVKRLRFSVPFVALSNAPDSFA